MIRRPPRSTLFPYHDALPISRGGVVTVSFGVEERLRVSRTILREVERSAGLLGRARHHRFAYRFHVARDRKSTRLNSSHANISYAVFCLKKKNNTITRM